MPAPTDDIERRRYEVRRADLAAVRQRVAELHVSAPPGTARLLVDGREVTAGGPVFVAPGQHEVTATGKQGQVARALVKVTAGESRHVALAFEAPKAASAPAQARNPWTLGGCGFGTRCAWGRSYGDAEPDAGSFRRAPLRRSNAGLPIRVRRAQPSPVAIAGVQAARGHRTARS